MIQASPISNTISTFAALEQKFKLLPTNNELFFREWQQDLPDLTIQEKETLEEIKQRFDGLIGNGDEFMFIKMITAEMPQYDFSNIYSLLLPRRNQLEDVLKILKQIAQIMAKHTGGN